VERKVIPCRPGSSKKGGSEGGKEERSGGHGSADRA
jgi:hypothetical protein